MSHQDLFFGLPPAAVYPLAFVFGSLWGSFLNVCIARLPEGRSVVWPGSHCGHCKTPIRGYDNIPIFSYLLLRGRCRACKEPYSARYPLVELLVGMLALALVHNFGLSWTTLAYFLLTLGLVVATFIDLAWFIIPNEVTFLLLPVGLGMSFIPGATVRPLDAAIGAAAGYGVLWLVATGYAWLRKVNGLGGGDVKLLGVLGAFFGWKALPLLLFMSAAQGVVAALVIFLVRRGEPLPVPTLPGATQAPSTPATGASGASGEPVPPAPEDDDGPPPGRLALPFGPFLALSAFELLFFGDTLSIALFGAVLF